MESSSSDDTGSEDILESLTGSYSKRRRSALSKGEKSKQPLAGMDDSDQDTELGTLSWHQPTSLTGAGPSFSDQGPVPRMSFELDDDQDESDFDDDSEGQSVLDDSYGVSNSNFCWPPPGIENVMPNDADKKVQDKKKRKPGIVYLSSIPTGFNVSRTTSYFSQFGQVGRVFLQPGI